MSVSTVIYKEYTIQTDSENEAVLAAGVSLSKEFYNHSKSNPSTHDDSFIHGWVFPNISGDDEYFQITSECIAHIDDLRFDSVSPTDTPKVSNKKPSKKKKTSLKAA